jgi:hypothetical protein
MAIRQVLLLREVDEYHHITKEKRGLFLSLPLLSARAGGPNPAEK